MSQLHFPYNLEKLSREKKEYYIPASDQEIQEMLETLNLKSLDDLYNHINDDIKLDKNKFLIEKSKNYDELAHHLIDISKKNQVLNSLVGDGLAHYEPSPIINDICSIRGLTTAYTPYQPEKSQGTLKTLWIYQSVFKELTGFEAINASLYDRSMGIFEAIKCAIRISRSDKKILIIDSLYEGDKEVLKTLTQSTGIQIDYLSLNDQAISSEKTLSAINPNDYCCLVFSQTTRFATLEEVDLLTDFASKNNLIRVAVIDPLLLTNKGLKKPRHYGSQSQGVNIITGEAHHLSLDKNFGGPGLGIFGVRFNKDNKVHIRQAPGRFVGKALDEKGQICQTLILSTREQHIRKDKATSNICSNQSFIASLAGANILHWGDGGLTKKITQARENCLNFLEQIRVYKEVELSFQSHFFNEVSINFNSGIEKLFTKAKELNIELGVIKNHPTRKNQKVLKMFFNELSTQAQVKDILDLFKSHLTLAQNLSSFSSAIASNLISLNDVKIASHPKEDVVSFYKKLGELNFSPDDGVYPLGSCTMKYNPYINDYCAGLHGFTQTHPQTEDKFVQGNLEILFEIQEFFKNLTGLPGVTTQPVAGAQGELVGLKLFQAYQQSLGEERNFILIPKSAHGTNPATANVAGYQIKYLEANEQGQIDLVHLRDLIEKFPKEIAGIMITNPNTSGIFEVNFKEISQMIHDVGGLVYMDGANMNAIAGHVDLEKMGVDAVHNNLHKTWTVPHGGGGPGDAIVAVSEKLVDFLPGRQIKKIDGIYESFKPLKSIGSFHRHWGNFAHKVRCYTYIKALGSKGVRKMSAVAVLSANYIHKKIQTKFLNLPLSSTSAKMHEFIITLSEEMFKKLDSVGIAKSQAIARVGKLFLDFGFHAPTVAFPEVYGLMIEPTESFSKAELDEFIDALFKIHDTILETPELLVTTPHFTPVSKIDELSANKNPIIFEEKFNGTLFEKLEIPGTDFVQHNDLKNLSLKDIKLRIQETHSFKV